MDILPFASVTAAQASSETGRTASADREGWKRTLEGVGDEDGEWCLFTVDVRNTYGIPFEVTFERQQEGMPSLAGPLSLI
jgi:trafficking protein particle complex subunit 9